jgi:hypothetical protein
MKRMIGNLKPLPDINRSGDSANAIPRLFNDHSLKGHTIFAPVVLPEGKKLHLLLRDNEGCRTLGQAHENALSDIALQ